MKNIILTLVVVCAVVMAFTTDSTTTKPPQLVYVAQNATTAKSYIDKMYTQGWYLKNIVPESIAITSDGSLSRTQVGGFLIVLQKN